MNAQPVKNVVPRATAAVVNKYHRTQSTVGTHAQFATSVIVFRVVDAAAMLPPGVKPIFSGFADSVDAKVRLDFTTIVVGPDLATSVAYVRTTNLCRKVW